MIFYLKKTHLFFHSLLVYFLMYKELMLNFIFVGNNLELMRYNVCTKTFCKIRTLLVNTILFFIYSFAILTGKQVNGNNLSTNLI